MISGEGRSAAAGEQGGSPFVFRTPIFEAAATARAEASSGGMTSQFAALLAILAIAPLPLGGNRPWAIGLLGAAILVLFACHLIWPERSGPRPAIDGTPFERGRSALWAMGAWTSLLAIQLIPLPTALVRALDFGSVAAFPVDGAWTTISVDPYSTRVYLGKAVALSALFALLLRMVTTPTRVEMLAKTVVVCGCLQAIAGIALFAMHARYSLFFVGIDHARATGTFVNHNHFAGYLEMSLAVGIGLMLSKLDRTRSRTWRQSLTDWLAVLVSDKARLRLMLIVMVIGLIASRSRMGNGAFLFSLTAVTAVTMMVSRRVSRSMALFIVSLVVLDVALIGSVVGLDNVVRRIEQTRLHNAAAEASAQWAAGATPPVNVAADPMHARERAEPREETIEQRTAAARSAVELVRTFPVAGTGGGAFHVAYMPFRPPQLRGYFDHVHNDFVEFAVETGVLGLLLLGSVVAGSAARALRILAARRERLARGMAFATLMGTTALLVHSVVDFNLQIPANAMVFLVIVALPYLVGTESNRLESIAGVCPSNSITSS